jgi:hypothetical protein
MKITIGRFRLLDFQLPHYIASITSTTNLKFRGKPLSLGMIEELLRDRAAPRTH